MTVSKAHLSYVSRSIFYNRGYKVLGAGFGKPSNLFVRAIKKFNFSWEPMFESVIRVIPSMGELIVAYKDMN